MKNVRLFYKKEGLARFVSHLDTMRCMTRLMRRAELPVWYTEGFNPHLYITFAMPLSLGMSSVYEIADIRLNDDNAPLDGICGRLNENCPDGYFFFAAKEPVKKLSELKFAKYRVELEDGGELCSLLEEFLSADEITLEKKTKRGEIKTFNAAPDIAEFSLEKQEGTTLYITLPAGNDKTVKPELIVNKFLLENKPECYCKITRTLLLDGDMRPLE